MVSAVQTPVQIAWVTADLGATEKALTTLLGAKKWVRMPSLHFGPESCTYRGQPADFVADISLSYAGDTQPELIAPVSGDSIHTEFLRDSPGSITTASKPTTPPASRRHSRRPVPAARPSCNRVRCPGGCSSPMYLLPLRACRSWRSRSSRRRSGHFSTM